MVGGERVVVLGKFGEETKAGDLCAFVSETPNSS
jgi:hypothetical protein